MSKRVLIRSTGVIGFATAVSRVLGFVRDIIIANLFGTGSAIQAFFVAFRIPNMFRDLIGEGAMNAAVVPVLSAYRTKDDFLRLVRVLFNLSFVALLIVTVLGVVFSPLIVRLIAPGFIDESGTLELTILLNRLIFPYVILIGLTAMAMGVLNSVGHFAAPAFGPCLLNLAMILAVAYLGRSMGVFSLVLGVMAGGALQLALNIPALRRRGLGPDPRSGLRHEATRKIAVLMVPRALGSGVYQINVFVDTILASLVWIVGAGGVAALYYANRLIQFPLAIFSLALAQAALPKMSREAASGDMGRFKDTLSFALRSVLLVILPAGFGLACLGEPIVRILFERGEFDAYSTTITQSALFFYALGLASFSGIKILVSCFYALQDTMTPVKTAGIAVAANIVLSLVLMWPLRIGGLALSTSISATLNFFLLFTALRRKIGALDEKRILDTFLRALVASAAAGGAALLTYRLLSAGGPASTRARATFLLCAMAVAIGTYLAAALALRVKEIKEIAGWISTKR